MLLLALTFACRPLCTKPGGHDDVDWFAAQAEPAVGTWPQYRLDASHRGLAPDGTALPTAPETTWVSDAFAIGEYTAAKGSPSVTEDAVYVGIDDGVLRKLSLDDGSLIWSFATRAAETEAARDDDENRGIHGTPAIADGRVFIGAYDGWLYALDEDDGSLLWERQLGGSIGASPAVHQGHVFIAVEYGDPDGKVFALDAEDGCAVFESPYIGDHPHSSATIDPVRAWLFVGANNGGFFAFDFASGEEMWEVWMDQGEDGDIKSTAAVDGDTVYITSWDHQLHAVDIDSGQERFAFATEQDSMSSPSVHDGVAYFGSHDGGLYAIDADPDATYADDQERELWRYATSGRILSSPTIVPDSNALLIGSNDGSLSMVDMANGLGLWEVALDGRVSSVPVATGGMILATDAAGQVWRWD